MHELHGPSPGDAACPGCSCGRSNRPDDASDPSGLGHPDGAEPEPSTAHLLLAPIGLFVLPIVAAVLGAAWGDNLAAGHLIGGFLGGLSGLILGMGAATLVARLFDRRTRTNANRD